MHPFSVNLIAGYGNGFRLRFRAMAAPILVILVTTITFTKASAMNTELNIHVLDVGQGDAMLLHQPGACSLLIDAGPLINGYRITEKLETLGIESLDIAIVTHPHLDHFGGLFELAPRVPIGTLYDNGMVNDTWEYFDDYVTLRTKYRYQALSRGMQITCGDIALDVLYPLKDAESKEGLNNTSAAMLISFHDFSLLHMGDLAGDGEKKFLTLGKAPHADIIKIAHHGAVDSASKMLLEQVSPNLALISTAAQNRIGSPAAELLERLAAHGITSYRTDQTGDILIRVQPDGYLINSSR